MKRLRHTATSVQILVTDEKAARLVRDGTYAAVPDAEQPPKEPAMPKPAAQSKGKPATDINAAIAQGAPNL